MPAPAVRKKLLKPRKIAAAEKINQYQEALKQARAKVYQEQEAWRKKLLGGTRCRSERCAYQGHGRSEFRQRTRGRRICVREKRNRVDHRAAGRRDRATDFAGATGPGQSGKRGTMTRGVKGILALLPAVFLLMVSVARARKKAAFAPAIPQVKSSSGSTSLSWRVWPVGFSASCCRRCSAKGLT